MKSIFTLAIVLFAFTLFGQQSGHWDFNRAIEKSFPLPDTEKKIITVNLPIGTTQILYRVSFLSPSAEVTNKIAQTLSVAPSLTIQGASMALNVISTLGGTNKGQYNIFTDYENANKYYLGLRSTACYVSLADIPGEKNYIELSQNTCLKQGTTTLYFSFYNGNYFYDEQVLLEVVPWIDFEASKGWTLEAKNIFMDYCLAHMTEDITLKKEVCGCVLEKFQAEHKVHELGTLTESELETISKQYSEQCIKGTGEHENILNFSRADADLAAEQGDYSKAINAYLEIIKSGSATVGDYNNLGWYYILTKQFLKATKYLKEGEKLDETELIIKGNLAHAYLLSGDLESAKAIYVKYKTQNVDEKTSWCQMVKGDFEALKSKGISCEQFSEILNLLK